MNFWLKYYTHLTQKKKVLIVFIKVRCRVALTGSSAQACAQPCFCLLSETTRVCLVFKVVKSEWEARGRLCNIYNIYIAQFTLVSPPLSPLCLSLCPPLSLFLSISLFLFILSFFVSLYPPIYLSLLSLSLSSYLSLSLSFSLPYFLLKLDRVPVWVYVAVCTVCRVSIIW